MLHYYQTHDLLRIYHVYAHTDVWTTTYIFHRHTLNMHIYITLNTDGIRQHTMVDVYVNIRISQHFL